MKSTEINPDTLQSRKQAKKLEQTLSGNVYRLVAINAVFTIMTMLVSSMYSFADTYFVSGLNDGATAAVGIVFSMVNFSQAMGYFWGQGSANYISRSMGKGNMDDSIRMAQIGFQGALISGSAVTVLGLCFLKPLCRFLGTPEEILPETCRYCAIILLGIPFFMASLVMNCQYRYQGNSANSMIGVCLGAILNIVLDPLMIYTLNMGLGGAALATVLSQAISFGVLLLQSRSSSNIPLFLRPERSNPHLLKQVIPGGIPSLWRNGMMSVSIAVLNTTAKPYGIAAVAAMSVVSRVMSVCVALPTGFGQGAQPVLGMNYGAGNYGRVKSTYRFTLTVAASMNLIVSAVVFGLAPQIVELFHNTGYPAVVQYGVDALRYQCITFPLTAFLLITNMMVQSMGKIFSGTFLAVARNGLFFIPIVTVLSRWLGFFGIQISQPLADVCAFLSTICVWLCVRRELGGKGKTEM